MKSKKEMVAHADDHTKHFTQKNMTTEGRHRQEDKDNRSFFGGFLIPVELGYKTTQLSHNEAIFFYLILHKVHKSSGKPCIIYPREIEELIGLNASQQRKTRASLFARDLIRYTIGYNHCGHECLYYCIPEGEHL